MILTFPFDITDFIAEILNSINKFGVSWKRRYRKFCESLLGKKQWRIQAGRNRRSPPKISSTMFVGIPFCIKMLQNEAEIARDSI